MLSLWDKSTALIDLGRESNQEYGLHLRQGGGDVFSSSERGDLVAVSLWKQIKRVGQVREQLLSFCPVQIQHKLALIGKQFSYRTLLAVLPISAIFAGGW